MKKSTFISIYLSILILSPIIVSSQFINKNQTIFENITKDKGLLNGHITDILQDKKGYLWLSTYGGLHRYDGQTFDYYLHNDSIKESLSNNSVHTTFLDSKNRLWVGSENGLSLFVPQTNNFINYNEARFSFGKNSLREIIEDRDGKLWIATYGGGIAKFDPEKEEIIKWYTLEKNLIPGNFINTIFVDSKGLIWAGLESKGLLVFDFKTEKFIQRGLTLADKTISSIKEDKNGKLWIGTWTGGLSCYDPNNETIKTFQHNSSNSKSIPDYTVRQIEIDKKNMIWLATTNGLGLFNPVTETCISFQNNKHSDASLSYNFLWSVFEDKEGIIWVGTFGNGLCKLDPNKNKFDIINNQSKTCSIDFSYIDFIKTDSKGILWASASDGGIYAYKPSQECIIDNKIGSYFKDKKVRCLYEDKNGYYWFGCEDGIIRSTADFKQSTFLSLK